MAPFNPVLDPKPSKRKGESLITNDQCPQELKEDKNEFPLMEKNKVDNKPLSIMQFVLEELHWNEIDKAYDDYLGQVSNDKVTLISLNSDFDSISFKEDESNLLIKEKGLIKDIKECALDVLSENEDKVE